MWKLQILYEISLLELFRVVILLLWSWALQIFSRTLESCTAAFSFQVCARDLSNCWREYLSGRTKVEYECFFQKENHVGWQLTCICCKNTYYSIYCTYLFSVKQIYMTCSKFQTMNRLMKDQWICILRRGSRFCRLWVILVFTSLWNSAGLHEILSRDSLYS